MITIEQAKNLTYRDNLYFLDKSGTRVLQCRVNGAVKLWKRRPNDFRIPVKYGLYEYAYVGTTPDAESPDRFYLDKSELDIFLAPQIKGRIGTKKQIAALNNLLR